MATPSASETSALKALEDRLIVGATPNSLVYKNVTYVLVKTINNTILQLPQEYSPTMYVYKTFKSTMAATKETLIKVPNSTDTNHIEFRNWIDNLVSLRLNYVKKYKINSPANFILYQKRILELATTIKNNLIKRLIFSRSFVAEHMLIAANSDGVEYCINSTVTDAVNEFRSLSPLLISNETAFVNDHYKYRENETNLNLTTGDARPTVPKYGPQPTTTSTVNNHLNKPITPASFLDIFESRVVNRIAKYAELNLTQALTSNFISAFNTTPVLLAVFKTQTTNRTNNPATANPVDTTVPLANAKDNIRNHPAQHLGEGYNPNRKQITDSSTDAEQNQYITDAQSGLANSLYSMFDLKRNPESIIKVANPNNRNASSHISNRNLSIQNVMWALKDAVNKLSRLRLRQYCGYKLTTAWGDVDKVPMDNSWLVLEDTKYLYSIMPDSYIIKGNINGKVDELVSQFMPVGQPVTINNVNALFDALYEVIYNRINSDVKQIRVIHCHSNCHSSCHSSGRSRR